MDAKLKNLLEHPELISEDAIKELSATVRTRREAFDTAVKAYECELNTRRDNLRSQADNQRARIDKLTEERERLTSAITDATARGDLEAASLADAELEQVERDIATCERKVRLADAAKLKGDPTLYDALLTAYNALCAACAEQRSAITELRTVCQKQEKRYRGIYEQLPYLEESSYPAGSIWEKIVDEYTGGPARRAAAAEEAKRERDARATARNGVRVSFSGEPAPLKSVDTAVVAAREEKEQAVKERVTAIERQNRAANDATDGARRYVLG